MSKQPYRKSLSEDIGSSSSSCQRLSPGPRYVQVFPFLIEKKKSLFAKLLIHKLIKCSI